MLHTSPHTCELPYEYPMLPKRLLSAPLAISMVPGSKEEEASGRMNSWGVGREGMAWGCGVRGGSILQCEQ